MSSSFSRSTIDCLQLLEPPLSAASFVSTASTSTCGCVGVEVALEAVGAATPVGGAASVDAFVAGRADVEESAASGAAAFLSWWKILSRMVPKILMSAVLEVGRAVKRLHSVFYPIHAACGNVVEYRSALAQRLVTVRCTDHTAILPGQLSDGAVLQRLSPRSSVPMTLLAQTFHIASNGLLIRCHAGAQDLGDRALGLPLAGAPPNMAAMNMAWQDAAALNDMAAMTRRCVASRTGSWTAARSSMGKVAAHTPRNQAHGQALMRCGTCRSMRISRKCTGG